MNAPLALGQKLHRALEAKMGLLARLDNRSCFNEVEPKRKDMVLGLRRGKEHQSAYTRRMHRQKLGKGVEAKMGLLRYKLVKSRW